MLKKVRVLQSQSQPQRVEAKKQPSNLEKVQSNCVSTRIHQLVKNPWGDGSQQTLLFSAPAVSMQNARKRYLVLKNMNYLISNWTHDEFPNVIYICLKDYQGYTTSKIINETSVVVSDSRIAALQLDSIQASVSDDLKTYEIRYTLRDVVTWQLPLSMTQIDLSVKLDDNLVSENLPLPNPLTLNIQVKQQK